MKNNTKTHPELKSTIACKTKYGYQLFHAESYWDKERGYSTKRNKKQIGFIKDPNGIGFCKFNESFLNKYPEFKDWDVKRVGVNKFEYYPKSQSKINEEKQHVISNIDNQNTKISKFGDSLFMMSLFAKSTSMQILKSLLPSNLYEMIELIIMTLMSYGSKGLAYNVNAFKRDHFTKFTSEVDNVDKDTLQRLYTYLDEHNIAEEFAKKKAEYTIKNRKDQYKTMIALDGSNFDNAGNKISLAKYGKSKSGNDTPIVNFVSLIDQETKELFSIHLYSGSITDISTVEYFSKELKSLGLASQVCVVSDRGYWSTNNISAYMENSISFIANCNIARNKNIKEKVIEYGDMLMYRTSYTNDDIIESIEDSSDRLTFHTDVEHWSFTKKIAYKNNINEVQKIYVHYVFNSNIYNDLLDKVRNNLDKINNVYRKINDKEQWTKIINKEVSILGLKKEDLTLIEKGIIYFNPTQNEYFINIKQFNALKGYIGATRVICSNYIENAVEAERLYKQRNNIECSYRTMKNQLEGETLNASTNKTIKSKILLLAIANEIIQNIIDGVKKHNQTCKQDEEVHLDNNSVKATLRDLESICVKSDNRNKSLELVGGVNKKHLDLFKALNMIALEKFNRSSYANEEGFIDYGE